MENDIIETWGYITLRLTLLGFFTISFEEHKFIRISSRKQCCWYYEENLMDKLFNWYGVDLTNVANVAEQYILGSQTWLTIVSSRYTF